MRDGIDETLTLQHLEIAGRLRRKLRTTNAVENLNSGIATYTRNVKRWQGGSMAVRWVSAAIQESEKKSRRVQGFRNIDKLMKALERVEAEDEAAAKRVASDPTRSCRSEKITSERDNPVMASICLAYYPHIHSAVLANPRKVDPPITGNTQS